MFFMGNKMKIDIYSKAVLTIIAGCLVLQTIDRFIPDVAAQSNRPTKVTICDINGNICADIRGGRDDGLVVAQQ